MSKPHFSQSDNFKSEVMLFAVLVVSAMLMFVVTQVVPQYAMKLSLFESHEAASTEPTVTSANAHHDVYDFMETYGLSQDDRVRYIRIFALQDAGAWREADEFIFRLTSTELMPYVLAQRYVDARYQPTVKQFTAWLDANAELTQFDDVFARFKKLFPQEASAWKKSNKDSLNTTKENIQLTKVSGIEGDDTPITIATRGTSYPYAPLLRAGDVAVWRKAMQSFSEGRYTQALNLAQSIILKSGRKSPSAYYMAGLSAWQLGQKEDAAKYFSSMADCACSMPDEERAAAAFWTFRANDALKHTSNAAHYLRVAANLPNSFYGLIAEATLNDSAVWQVVNVDKLSAKEWDAAAKNTLLKRVMALTAIGKKEEAQHIFYAAYQQNPALQGLMRQLGEALEISLLPVNLAERASGDYAQRRYAKYQIPSWTRSLQRATDKALVLAIVRQESGFNPRAGSPAGAQGLMQLMPATAAFMEGRHVNDYQVASNDASAFGVMDAPTYNLHDASYNLRLGQAYLRHLKAQPNIRSNIVMTAAAYNAGPNVIKDWIKTPALEDPLMFIESIPYGETRGYVKNVLRNYWVYQSLLKQPSNGAASIGKGVWPVVASSSR